MMYPRDFVRLATVLCMLVLACSTLHAQDDLEALLGEETDETKWEYSSGAFKGTRIINGHSVELRNRGTLEMIISHRFGRINSGIRDLFGLDIANIRIGLDYALNDRLTVGAGRSSFQKLYDGFLKYRLMSQADENTPVSVVAYSNMAINTQKWSNPERGYRPADRFSFVHQLLVARKLSTNTSVQLMPSVVHRNLVIYDQEDNLIYALGAGGRQKITPSLALTFEYYYQFNNNSPVDYYNSFAVGIDIETGGHVFQLHFTNSNPTFERGVIAETTGDFFAGDIHFGFNITRAFQLN